MGVISLNKNRCNFNTNLVVNDYTTCLEKSSLAAGFEQGTRVTNYDELKDSPE